MAKSTDKTEVKQLKKRVSQLEKELATVEASEHKRRFNWRSPLVILMVGLAGVFFTIGAMTFAFNRTINDTDAYMRSIGPVIQQPAVQKAIVKEAQTAIQDNVDVNKIVTNALPPEASFLAGPITSQVNSQIGNFLSKIVASDKFYQVWINTNRNLHDSTINFIKDSDGNPTIDVSQLYTFLSTELQGTPLSALGNKTLPPKIGAIKVTSDAQWLPVAHQTLKSLPWIQNISLLLSVAFGAGAIFLAKKRHLTGTLLSSYIVGLMLIVLAAIGITQHIALQNITDPINKDAAAAIWSTVLAPLYGYIATLITLGVIGAVVTWFASGYRPAVASRRGAAKASSKVHNLVFRGHDKNSVVKYTRQYRHGVEWLIVAVSICLFLFVFRPLTVSIVLTTFVIGLAISAILELISSN